MATDAAAYLSVPLSWGLTGNAICDLQELLNEAVADRGWRYQIIVLPPGSRVEEDGIDTAAIATHEMFMALKRAGFSDEQALRLVMHQLGQAAAAVAASGAGG